MPERVAALEAVLEASSPVALFWHGPVFRQAEGLACQNRIAARAQGSESVDRDATDSWADIAEAFPWLAATLAECAPIVVSREAGCVAAVCYRTSGASHLFAEAGVDTRPEFRERGHAARATAGWWQAVRVAGGEPLYATTWDNAGSLGVARALGLTRFADTCHWT